MIITHNMGAMNAQRQFGINTNNKAKTVEKLASGYKINRAADDAAGLTISEKMRFQIRGLNQGAQNIQEGVGYCQVADGALNEIHDMLHRITELSVQAANGTNSIADRECIRQEIEQIKEEMDRICSTTKYNEEYIFADSNDDYTPPYTLAFSGILRDIYVYNETFSDASGNTTVTYGGIAYEGKRYAWSSINPNMYDPGTNTFRAGKYTLTADDGSYVTLVCEDGSEPPQVSREFTTSADDNGIYINNERIRWEDVKTSDGTPFDKNNILNESYYFSYCGVTGSFTPEEFDGFGDVLTRISGIKLESTYNLPTEETALFADFSKSYSAFLNDDEVKEYLENGSMPQTKYTLCADVNGVSITDGSGNTVTDSDKTWAELGITNWGDKSEDIWFDKIYNYVCEQTNATQFEFSFEVINEISRDSVIAALNGVELTGIDKVETANHVEVNKNSNNILSADIVRDTTDISLKEEYELGRDYTTGSDEYGNEEIQYDSANKSFSVSFTGSRDIGNDGITTKTYSNTEYETNNIVTNIKNQILNDADEYLSLVLERYRAGAKNPTDINLTSVIGSNAITGQGGNTYLEETLTFDVTDSNLKNTLNFSGTETYAGAKIDFSKLGTDYQLADLIGMGFNSTCQTCDNHYSIQFTVPDSTSDNWTEIRIDGETYKYNYEKQGNNHTLYIDIESMQNNQVNNGVDFTNKLVDILDASGYDFHYTQYATYTDNAELYIFDNRPEYVDENGSSTATQATFSPYAYEGNSIADFELNLYDTTDSNKGVSIKYQYDYKSLFEPDNLNITAAPNDTDGLYVFNANTNQYELYDSGNPAHASVNKYDITNIEINTNDLNAYVENYIRNTIFTEISKSSMVLAGDYARYALSGSTNNNKAMVTTFTAPEQVMPEMKRKPERTSIRIQCSSNTIDEIMIKKQTLSVNKMGLHRLDVTTEEKATRSIDLTDKALSIVSSIRSAFGAYQNRLEHAYAINRNAEENTQAAESGIRDADMAKEMFKFSTENILEQVGQAMMAQANQSTQGVLNLL